MSEMVKQRFTAIDFFCGGGGMTCGLRQSGIDVIAGVDFDSTIGETYENDEYFTVKSSWFMIKGSYLWQLGIVLIDA